MKLHHDHKSDLIHRLPLFAGCSRDEVEAIARIADEIDLKVGKHLTEEGELGREFIIIVEGSVEVHKHGDIVATLGVDDFVGEISLVTGEPQTATVVALTPVTLLVIAGHKFSTLLDQTPGLREKVEAAVAKRQAE